eukprot:TRINITY_DN2051_c0_g1_i5.p1 TRINITY_DN2051_c0_g1~~TRINITY_DN2051_c0_g1_i5.p1  ORF type:complete len:557 (+),score=117.92 TRINITY_DN2051_c0_g1_i5:77-1747(+)
MCIRDRHRAELINHANSRTAALMLWLQHWVQCRCRCVLFEWKRALSVCATEQAAQQSAQAAHNVVLCTLLNTARELWCQTAILSAMQLWATHASAGRQEKKLALAANQIRRCEVATDAAESEMEKTMARVEELETETSSLHEEAEQAAASKDVLEYKVEKMKLKTALLKKQLKMGEQPAGGADDVPMKSAIFQHIVKLHEAACKQYTAMRRAVDLAEFSTNAGGGTDYTDSLFEKVRNASSASEMLQGDVALIKRCTQGFAVFSGELQAVRSGSNRKVGTSKLGNSNNNAQSLHNSWFKGAPSQQEIQDMLTRMETPPVTPLTGEPPSTAQSAASGSVGGVLTPADICARTTTPQEVIGMKPAGILLETTNDAPLRRGINRANSVLTSGSRSNSVMASPGLSPVSSGYRPRSQSVVGTLPTNVLPGTISALSGNGSKPLPRIADPPFANSALDAADHEVAALRHLGQNESSVNVPQDSPAQAPIFPEVPGSAGKLDDDFWSTQMAATTFDPTMAKSSGNHHGKPSRVQEAEYFGMQRLKAWAATTPNKPGSRGKNR